MLLSAFIFSSVNELFSPFFTFIEVSALLHHLMPKIDIFNCVSSRYLAIYFFFAYLTRKSYFGSHVDDKTQKNSMSSNFWIHSEMRLDFSPFWWALYATRKFLTVPPSYLSNCRIKRFPCFSLYATKSAYDSSFLPFEDLTKGNPAFFSVYNVSWKRIDWSRSCLRIHLAKSFSQYMFTHEDIEG